MNKAILPGILALCLLLCGCGAESVARASDSPEPVATFLPESAIMNTVEENDMPKDGIQNDAAVIAEETQQEKSEVTVITMTVGNTVITAELEDSETTREFLTTLPRTLTMNQYNGREYYGRVEAISENGAAIADFENGDVTYFPSGPSFAVFYAKADSSSQGGLIRMGRVTSDLSAFETLGESAQMLIEAAE